MLDTQGPQDSQSPPRGVMPAPFACTWDRSGHDGAWVRLSGEFDLATAERLERTLREAQRQARTIVVDMRQVAFADSSVIHALVEATEQARRESRRLVVLRGPAHLDRILAASGALDTVESLEVSPADTPDAVLVRLSAEQSADAADTADERAGSTG